MFDNEDDSLENDKDNELDALLSKFERCINLNENYFFEVEEIIELIEYYEILNPQMYKKALELGLHYYPHSPEILLKKAEFLAKENYTIKALQILNEIEPHLITEPQFYLIRGKIYSKMSLSEQAIHEYEKILSLDYSEKAMIYAIIGEEYYTQHQYDKALKYFQKTIRHVPENSILLYQIYTCYVELNKLEEGISFFQKLTDEYPFNSEAWMYLSSCYYGIHDYENALEAINFALAIDPSQMNAIQHKYHILKALNKYHEAIALLQETLNKESDNTDLLLLLGEIHNEISQHEQAVNYYHRVLSIDSTNTQAWLKLAHTYICLSQDNEAISCIRQAIKSDKPDILNNYQNNPETLIEAGKLYLQLELFEDALAILKSIHEQGYESTELIIYMSIALEKSGYAAEALNILTDEIYNKQNNNIELQYCLASILLLYQYRQEGLTILEKALQTNPSKYPIIYEFSECFEDDIEIQELIQHYLN